MITMDLAKNNFKDQLFLILAGVFVASLVTCNLIANKFVTVDLGFKVFIVSAGSAISIYFFGNRLNIRIIWAKKGKPSGFCWLCSINVRSPFLVVGWSIQCNSGLSSN